jgi:hypothetical protein
MKFNRLFLFISITLFAHISLGDPNTYIKFNQKFMNKNWSFLPEVPSSFKKNNYKEAEINYVDENFQINFKTSDINLKLERDTEPKEASLFANKDEFMLGYYLDEKSFLYLKTSKQDAETQKFDCYQFSSYIIGSCSTANLQINSTNEKYDVLEDNIIAIAGRTKSNGLGYQRNYDSFWIQNSYIEFLKTTYNYEWISPLEDIKSPLLLNFDIGGIKLGDALSDALARLPQRDQWQTNQLNIGFKQKFITIYDLNLFAEYDFTFFKFKDYLEYKKTPDYNFKLRLGVEFIQENFVLSFYGDLYKNNLIGFESITFNQRTEHYFDKPYGELGLMLKINF